MKYIVAVSGGVDSVVMLDTLMKANEHELIVAHFDHGIRDVSNEDARFVQGLANSYGLIFELGDGLLGADASEDTARSARYEFLFAVAEKHDAVVVTAHHQDDIVESIVINLTRGTGWRGLAPLNDPRIIRPLLGEPKQALYDYALQNRLEWVEDETNQTNAYLRNRVRRKLHNLSPEARASVVDLWAKQCALTKEINRCAHELSTESRYMLTMIDESTALELLRAYLAERSLSLTRPQRKRLLHAIKTARPGSALEAGQGVTADFVTTDFIVKHP